MPGHRGAEEGMCTEPQAATCTSHLRGWQQQRWGCGSEREPHLLQHGMPTHRCRSLSHCSGIPLLLTPKPSSIPGARTARCNLPPARIPPGEDIQVRVGSWVGSAGLSGPAGRGGLKQSNLAGAAHRDMNNGKLMLNWSHNFHTSANRSKL